MQASLIISTNIFNRHAYTAKSIGRRRTIASLAPKISKPFICVINGRALLRRDWQTTRINDHDVVVFMVCPPQGGGGGSNPLQVVLSVALSIAAPGLGTALAGALGMAGSSLAASIFGGIISFVGKALINSMFGQPNIPKHQTNASLSARSPTYDISAQGNISRLGDPIPVLYGRMKTFPNFAAQPYSEFNGNEQYLYQLFCVTQGHCDIDEIKIGDTLIASFPEVTYEVIAPGGAVNLFPNDVHTSSEVSGQELLSTLGPFVANVAGTTCNAIAIDVILPRGLYYANDKGGLDARSAGFQVEAQKINDAGTAIGAWVTLDSPTISAATTTAQRKSYRYNVAVGRYQVRLTRTTGKDNNSRVGNDLNWFGLRAYLPGTHAYGNITLLAMRMRATNSLNYNSSRMVNVVACRKLPIWNGTTWSAPTRTQSIAWALADMCRAPYGAGYADNRIALSELLALDTKFTTRGDRFDAIFDNSQTFWEALSLCAAVGRTKPYRQSGIIRFVRDEPRTLPVAMFNQRNITKGSVKVHYVMPTDETADVIEIQYFDENIWNWDFVSCALPDSVSAVPVKIKIFGVTNRNQAYREGMYLAARNKYRRTRLTLGTEMEGFIPSFGDLCGIQHDRPLWGQGGEVINYDATIKVITVSEVLDWSAGGTHYFSFRLRNGSMTSTYEATQGPLENTAILVAALAFSPDLGLDRERTSYTFGPAAAQYKRALVANIKPRDLHNCELEFELDDDRVHTAELSGIAGTTSPTSPLPVVITRPGVSALVVNIGMNGTSAIASWIPSPGAEHYVVDISYDDGASWQRVAEPTASSSEFSILPMTGSLKIRVAAVGLTQGDFTVWSGNIYANILPLPDVQDFVLTQPFVGKSAKLKWATVAGATNYTITVYSTNGGNTLRRTITVTDTTYEYTYEDARADGGPWRNLMFKIKANSAHSASANFTTLDANNPQIPVPSGLYANAGPMAVTIGATKPSDTDFAGMLIYGSTVSGFTPGAGNLLYDGRDFSRTFTPLAATIPMYFKVAFYDDFGIDSLNFSTEISATPLAVGGIPTVTTIPTTSYIADVVYCLTDQNIYQWQTDHYVQAEPIIAANRIFAASLSAISANLGNITGGSLDIAGKFSVTSGGNVSIKSANTGARVEQTNTYMKIFNSAGTLVVHIGDLSA